jgi:acyl-CoA synthetase (AMP-forming)/AMP-acid ligase II
MGGARPRDFVSILRELASREPERAVCHGVRTQRRRLHAEPLTALELARGAASAGRALERSGARAGDRVLLAISEPRAFLVWLFAALARGLIAVPVPPVGGLGASEALVRRIRSIAADCGPRTVVAEGRARWETLLGGAAPDAVLLEGDLAATDGPCDLEAELAPCAPESTAILQYTSGSTGAPRGVVLSHANLTANCDASGRAAGFSAEDRMVSWLPLHHDMGLIGGLLVNLYWRMPAYVMPPMTFLLRPASWLRAIHDFGATVSVGPTFAYHLCTRAIDDAQMTDVDLSRWRLAFVGAEAVAPTTLDAFSARFRAHGFARRAFFPVYGLAEATLAVAFPSLGDEFVVDSIDRGVLASTGRAVPVPPGAGAVTFVSVGAALPDHQVAIVSPENGEPMAERQAGEIVVQGPSLSGRYFHETPDTKRTELRTGDLGYLAEGRLYVIDRIKDVVIVAGQNYAAPDIEASIADMVGLRPGRAVAFASPGSEGTEDLWVVAETDCREGPERAELSREVELRVLGRIGIAPRHVVLVAPGTIELTTSGKLCRRLCRAQTLGTA